MLQTPLRQHHHKAEQPKNIRIVWMFQQKFQQNSLTEYMRTYAEREKHMLVKEERLAIDLGLPCNILCYGFPVCVHVCVDRLKWPLAVIN